MLGRTVRLSRIDLNRLNVFLEVAACGGVSAAARELALTPSAVSQSLSALEANLDLQLFDRVGRRLVLTREGRILRSRFRVHRDALRDLLEELTGEAREVAGSVRVGLFLGFPREPLVRFLSEYSALYPKANVKLVYGARAELDEALAGGRVDFAFAFDRGGGSGIAATRLLRQELVLVGSKEHAPARGMLSLEALSAAPIVDYYRSEPLIHRWIAHHHRRRPPALDVRVWAATTNLVLDLVLDGVGIGVLPLHLVEPELRRRRLRRIRSDRPELVDHIWLKERAGGYRGPALEAFRARALEAFAKDTT